MTTHPVFVDFEKIKISHWALHVFLCLIHFQPLFGSSTMNDETRKSLLCKLLYDVCQAIKMHIIVLRYRFRVKILGIMYMKFLFYSVVAQTDFCVHIPSKKETSYTLSPSCIGTFWRIGSYFPLQVSLLK